VSRRAIDRDQAGFAAVIEISRLRCRIAILDAVLVEDVFHDGIGRAIIPSRVVIKAESDCSDRTRANIRAPPAARSLSGIQFRF